MSDGIPSPNPDYPQQIKNVTGNANVKIQNKNLFVAQKIVDDSHNSNTYILDGFIRYITGDDRLIIKPSIIKENMPYTFKLIAKSGTTNQNGISFNAFYTDGTNGTVYTNQRTDTNEFIISFRTNNNKTLDYIRSNWTLAREAFIKIDGSMILEGSYTAQTIPDYVPHQEQNYPFTFAQSQRAMQGTQLLDDGIHNTWNQITITEAMLDRTIITSYSELDYIRFGTPANYISKGTNNTSLMSCANENKEWTFNNKKYIGTFTNKIQYNYFYIGIPKGTSFEEIKDKIIGQTLEYRIKKEDIIPYNATQQAQYNAKKEASSYDDITYISSESDELGFDMNVVAVADANKVIESQNNEIDTIKSRLDLLEG